MKSLETGRIGYDINLSSASHHPEHFLCLDIGYGPSPKFEVIGDHVVFLLIEEVGLLDGEQKRLLHRLIGVGVRQRRAVYFPIRITGGSIG